MIYGSSKLYYTWQIFYFEIWVSGNFSNSVEWGLQRYVMTEGCGINCIAKVGNSTGFFVSDNVQLINTCPTQGRKLRPFPYIWRGAVLSYPKIWKGYYQIHTNGVFLQFSLGYTETVGYNKPLTTDSQS